MRGGAITYSRVQVDITWYIFFLFTAKFVPGKKVMHVLFNFGSQRTRPKLAIEKKLLLNKLY